MEKILNISGTEIKDSGIRKLAEYVKANLPDSTLIIGCKPSIYDVDAILIHNNNIFAIECKDWKGTITGGSYGWWQKDGQVIENPLQQARNNTVALGKWLRTKFKNVKGSIWVKGILLFTHEEGQVTLEIDETSNTGVEILDLSELKEYISRIPVNKNNEIGKNVIGFFSYYIKESSRKNIKLVKYLNYACVGLLFIAVGGIISLIKGHESAMAVLFGCIILAVILSFFSAAAGNASEEENIEKEFFEYYDTVRESSYDPINYYDTYKE